MLLPSDYFNAGAHLTDGTLVSLLNAANQEVAASSLATMKIPSDLPDGSIIRTLSPRAYWQLSFDSTLQESEGKIVANGSKRWVRIRQTDESYQSVAHWYSHTDGDWTASGTTAEEPTTFEEILRRLNGQISVAVVVHVMNPHTQTIQITIHGPTYPASLVISGSGYATNVATGTVSAYTATAPASALGVAGQRGHLTADINLSSYVGKMCRVTSGDQTGAQFVILGTSDDGGVEISVPELTPFWGDPVDIDVGSTFVVEDIPAFGSNLRVFGAVDMGFDNVNIGNADAHGVTISCRSALLNSCLLGSTDVRNSDEIQILNCYFRGAWRIESIPTCIMWLGACSATGPIEVRDFSHMQFYYVVSRRAPIIYPNAYGEIMAGAWLAVFDTTRALDMAYDSRFDASAVGAKLWSENISANPARVSVYGVLRVRSSSMPPVNGSGNEYTVGGTTKTSAQIASGPGFANQDMRVVVI